MLSKREERSEASKAEYKVTCKGNFSTEWTISSAQEPSKYLKFPAFGPCMLLDKDKNPVGKIASDKFWDKKKLIQLNTNSSQLRVQWHPKTAKYLMTGQTDIKGFEEIRWKWRVKKWNSKFILKNQRDNEEAKEKDDDEEVIAEFRRSSWKAKEVGFLYIYQEFPPDINSFIVYSACFCINHVKEEESAGSAIGGG